MIASSVGTLDSRTNLIEIKHLRSLKVLQRRWLLIIVTGDVIIILIVPVALIDRSLPDCST